MLQHGSKVMMMMMMMMMKDDDDDDEDDDEEEEDDDDDDDDEDDEEEEEDEEDNDDDEDDEEEEEDDDDDEEEDDDDGGDAPLVTLQLHIQKPSHQIQGFWDCSNSHAPFPTQLTNHLLQLSDVLPRLQSCPIREQDDVTSQGVGTGPVRRGGGGGGGVEVEGTEKEDPAGQKEFCTHPQHLTERTD